nr:hypothetical protein [Tanacetum cinerariifolium]
MSDMTACFNDLSYIPLNNEQNEPTEGDIGETSNDPTQAKCNKFEDLYASTNEELYPDFMAKFTHFKVKDSNTSGKKVPKKVLRHFPIIPRLQRLYKSNHTIKEMTWHATEKCTKPDKMQHPLDGREWKDFDTKPLIDDLKDLWAKPGVETIDVATGLKFNMRAMVLWTIIDFLARSSLSGWSGQCYKAFPTYNKDTPSVNVLESILNTLLMNDKSKDTAKARQELKRLGIRSGLWLGQDKNGKCSKPQSAYCFTPEDRKKFSVHQRS